MGKRMSPLSLFGRHTERKNERGLDTAAVPAMARSRRWGSRRLA